jgi:hypothetical protein
VIKIALIGKSQRLPHSTVGIVRRQAGGGCQGANRQQHAISKEGARLSRRGVSQVALQKCEQVGLGHGPHFLGDERSLLE